MNSKFKYHCTTCGKEYDPGQIRYTCPACAIGNNADMPPKGMLKIVFNYENLKTSHFRFQDLKQQHWLPLLPIQEIKNLPPLHVGNTPLYNFRKLGKDDLGFDLFLKDDSQNPTFSFKDRASAIVSAFAKENGIETIVTASTGNAGSSLAGICASQGQKAIVMVPASAPVAKLTQIMMYGARIIPVKGSYDDAFDLSIKASETFGWYNRNTAYNPLTIEGKKSVSFEIFDQLNESLPDRIFVPVGDGVIISGVYIGFEDLLELGLIDKIPAIVAIQAEGSDNLVRNIGNKNFQLKPSNTLADSISVDYPRNFYMAKDFLEKYAGEWLTVSDEAIIDASKKLAKNTGLFAEPAAATAFAGILAYMAENKIPAGSRNVVLLTGSGLKDIQSVQKHLRMPGAIEPDIKNIETQSLS